jgi:hypothetical protein
MLPHVYDSNQRHGIFKMENGMRELTSPPIVAGANPMDAATAQPEEDP